ncbi:hypothetical protein KKG56_00870 [bacterium]|nr:hypothetical protein [bacterium]
MATRKENIVEKTLEILDSHPDGFQYSALVKEISKTMPDVPVNTIHGTVWDIHVQQSSKIYKPSRGLFRLTRYKQDDSAILPLETVVPESKQSMSIKEDDFYVPFADWLVNELEDCTKAIALGGNKFKDKWGTPDVVGKNESKRSDIIQAPIEIVSAEIKTDVNQLIIAFGQTCSYRLFSHKAYLVIPRNSPQDDIARLDSLCIIFGIGLILFNQADVDNPEFDIRVRAIKHDPDMYYVNKYMKLIEKELFQ